MRAGASFLDCHHSSPVAMPRLIAGLLLLATCSHALVTLLPAVVRSSRAGTVEMKHPDYFQRIARSEAGRPRLCVFRCVPHPPRGAQRLTVARGAAPCAEDAERLLGIQRGSTPGPLLEAGMTCATLLPVACICAARARA